MEEICFEQLIRNKMKIDDSSASKLKWQVMLAAIPTITN
jgi:hypothetical protein